MKSYVIEVSNKVEAVYKLIAIELDTSIETVMSDAVQLSAERLTLENFDIVDDV